MCLRSKYIHNYLTAKRKSQLVAFLLSFFVGSYGADRFYLEYNGVGAGKLVLTLFLCIAPCVPLCLVCCKSEKKGGAATVLVAICILCASLGIFIWWIIDWVLIVQNNITDGNGYGMVPNL